MMKNLMKALANFQQECPTIQKQSTADVTTQKGGKYSYKYADLPFILETVNPLLQKHGLLLSQPLISENGKTFVRTILWHLESGENLQTDVEVPHVSFTGMNDYQAIGSGITYFRRYSLSILGIITDEDTDASGEQVKKYEAKSEVNELPWMTQKQFETSVKRIQEASPNVIIEENGNQVELSPERFVGKLISTFRMKKEYKTSLLQEIEFQNTLNKVENPKELNPEIPY